MDRHRGYTYSLHLSTKGDEKLRQILNVGLAGGIAEHRGSGRGGRSDERVLSGRHTGLVEKNVGSPKAVDAHVYHLAVSEARSKLLERQKVRIESPASYDIAARGRQRDLAATGE